MDDSREPSRLDRLTALQYLSPDIWATKDRPKVLLGEGLYTLIARETARKPTTWSNFGGDYFGRRVAAAEKAAVFEKFSQQDTPTYFSQHVPRYPKGGQNLCQHPRTEFLHIRHAKNPRGPRSGQRGLSLERVGKLVDRGDLTRSLAAIKVCFGTGDVDALLFGRLRGMI